MTKVKELDSDIIDREMQQAFHRGNGLTMLDFRTGSGKSYDLEKNLARYIYSCRKALLSETIDEPVINQIIVLIPNKNNFLHHDSLSRKLVEISNGEYTKVKADQVAKEDVFVMPNNLDCMIQGLSTVKHHVSMIDEEKIDRLLDEASKIFESQDMQKFKKDILCIKTYANCRNDSRLKVYADSLEESAKMAERELRSELRYIIKKYKAIEKDKNKTTKDRKEATHKKEKTIHLVESFFEIACMANYRVIVTSVDKFMYSIDPIVSPKVSFYDKDYIKDKLIIFDESDSAYVRMKKVIIERFNNSTFPFKEYLKNLICNYLESEPTNVIDKAIQGAFGKKNKRYSLISLRKRGKVLLEKYSLKIPYKTDEETEHKGKMPALLNDGTLYTLSEGKGYIHLIKSKEHNQILLRAGKGTEDSIKIADGDEILNLAGFLHEGMAFIRDFALFLLATARKYQAMMEQNNKVKARMKGISDPDSFMSEKTNSFHDDLQSILFMLGIMGDEQTFYIDLALSMKNNPQPVDLFDADISFYSKGYDLYLIKDNAINQHENSIINTYFLRGTPESILLHMAQCTHVICLSATALNRSINENFDISYLEENLPNFYTVSEKTKKKLRKFYEVKEKPYIIGQCSIDIIALPGNKDILTNDNKEVHLKAECELPVFRDARNRNHLLWKLQMVMDGLKNKYSEKDLRYIHGRYLNLAHGLYVFMADNTLKSMVVLEKAGLGEKDKYNIDLVQDIMKDISLDLDIKDGEVEIITALSADFKGKEEYIKEKWESGQKAILFSTYETTSKGSNLQYKIPEDPVIRNNLVTLLPSYAQDSRFAEKYKKKDIDCLYLGNYSYVLTQIEGNSLKERTASFHNFMFELQKLASSGQISYWQKRLLMEYSYRKVINQDFYFMIDNLKKAEGVKNVVNKVLKQSVGRIDRVNQKNRTTKIFVASENLKMLDLYELEATKDDLIPAMKEIYEKAKEIQGGISLKEHSQTEAARTLVLGESKHIKSVKCFNLLFEKARGEKADTRKKAIARYNKIREVILMHPIVSEEVYQSMEREEKLIVKQYYMDSHRNDTFSYVFDVNPRETGKDLDNCHIVMKGFNSTENGRRICEESTVLNKALSVKGLSAAFQQKDYCTSWGQGRYILTPKGVDIYNGILGEEIEKFILAGIIEDVRILNNGMLEIPEITEDLPYKLFEYFDFLYGNIYIDAKNWLRGSAYSDEEKFKKHIFEKRDYCDVHFGEKGVAVVLNLLPLRPIEDKDIVYTDNNYVEIRKLINSDGSINEVARAKIFELFRKANEHARKNKHN